MWKNYFILLLTINLFATSLEEANSYYFQGNYIKAIPLYKKIIKTSNNKKAKQKLINCYIKLGDNFTKVDNFKRALYWYNKALDNGSKKVKIKLAKLYAKKAKLYLRIKDYKKAKVLYKKAYDLGLKKAKYKLHKVDRFLNHEKSLKNDTRKVVQDQLSNWTQAIGRLITPTKLTFITKTRYNTKYKKCSASVVNFNKYSKSSVIITASHCLTGYNSKAGNLRFIIKSKSGEMLQRFATVYKDTHYKNTKLKKTSDYAILIIDKAISSNDITPLQIIATPFNKLQKQYKYSYASLAGYSGDIGDYGTKLTIDKRCKLFNYTNLYGKSNCSAYKGASGGPIILNLSNDNKHFKRYLVGIVSHFKHKDYRHIYFAPNNQFYKDLKEAIEIYNF